MLELRAVTTAHCLPDGEQTGAKISIADSLGLEVLLARACLLRAGRFGYWVGLH